VKGRALADKLKDALLSYGPCMLADQRKDRGVCLYDCFRLDDRVTSLAEL
jgi:hypothetical protein